MPTTTDQAPKKFVAYGITTVSTRFYLTEVIKVRAFVEPGMRLGRMNDISAIDVEVSTDGRTTVYGIKPNGTRVTMSPEDDERMLEAIRTSA